jgi:hypothetical protein
MKKNYIYYIMLFVSAVIASLLAKLGSEYFILNWFGEGVLLALLIAVSAFLLGRWNNMQSGKK